MNNKKTQKKIIAGLSITCLSALLMLSGCKIKADTSSSVTTSSEESSSTQSSSNSSTSSTLKDFDASIDFIDATVTYDGNEHQLQINNSTGLNIEYLSTYKFIDAGEYEIRARISKDGYNPKEITGKLTIQKANEDVSGITFIDVATKYNKEAQFVSLGGTLPTGITYQIKYYTDEACTKEISACINAGTYYAKATFTSRDNNHNPIAPMTCKLTIAKAEVDVPKLNSNYFYTGNEITAIESTSEYTVVNGSATNVGNYEATVVLTDTKNYCWKDSSFNGKVPFSITDPLSEVQYTGLVNTYNGSPKEISVSNLPENVEAAIKYYSDEDCKNEITAPTNAGKYYALISFSGTGLENQVLVRKQVLTINKQKVDVPSANTDLVYTGSPVVGVNPSDLYNVENGSSINVGATIATVTLKDTNNYEWSNSSFDGKIEYFIAAPQGIGMTNKEVTFNNTVQSLDIYGIENLDVEYEIKYYSDSAHTKEVTPINAGKYYAVATPNQNEYDVLTAELTINKAKLNLAFTSTNVQYTGESQKPSCSISSGIIDGTEVSVSLTGSEAINVGSYDFSVSLLGADKDNYYVNNSNLNITLVISKAKVAVPTLNECLYYTGDPVVAINPNSLYTVNFGSEINVGNYTANITLKDTNNYEWSDAEFTGNINYSITNPFSDITYNDIAYTYDGTNDELNSQLIPHHLTGTTLQIRYYSDEACTNIISMDDTINAGKYYYVVIYNNSATKETIKIYEAKSITVSKKALTITWDNKAVAYDGKAHLPSFKIEGLVNDDVVTGSFAEEGKKAIGTHTFTLQLSGKDIANYSFAETLSTTLKIIVPTTVEKITSLDSVVSGTYALGAQNSNGEIFFVTTNISKTSTIKIDTCNSTTDMSSYTIPSSDIWTIEVKDAEAKTYVIKIGDKYLSASSSSDTSLKLADTEYLWTLKQSENNPNLLYFANGERALLMRYSSSTKAFGFYGASNIGGNTYFVPSLYKVTVPEAKTVTLKESYTGGSVEATSSSGSLENLYFPDTITITMTPEEGKMVTSVKVGDKVLEAIKNEDGTYTATFNGSYGGEIEVVFFQETAIRDLAISYNNTTAEVTGFSDKYNETIIVAGTITVKEGFFIKDILLNGDSIIDKYNEATGELKFEMPEGKNSTLTIETDVYCDVTIDSEIANGSITIESDSVRNGSTVKVTFTAIDQYTLDKVLINSVEIDLSKLEPVSNSNKTIVYNLPISGDSLISASFKKMTTSSIAEVCSSDTASNKYYIFVGTIGDTSYSTIRIYENTSYVTLNSTLSTQIKKLGLGEGDKVKVYGYYTTSSSASFSKLLDTVSKPKDIIFEESTIMWNAVGSSFDLYYKTGDGDYTLVQSNIPDKSYNFDDTLENGTYTFKVVAHSLNGEFEDETTEITWNYGAKYSVTYDINGHGAQPTNLVDQTKLPSVLPILSATGYRFEGWYTKDGTDDDWGEEATPNSVLTANVTLYAKWVNATSEQEFILSIKDYADAKGWTNSTKYDSDSIIIENGIEMKVTKTGKYTGTYNEKDEAWKIYQSDSGAVTITSSIGKISKIVFTYKISNTGILVYNETEYNSNDEIAINNSSLTFTVGNTGTATNGQISIQSVKVYIVPDVSETEDVNKTSAETYINELSAYSSITKANANEVNTLLTTIEGYITAYVNNGGQTSDISNYSLYSQTKTLINSFNSEKNSSKTTATTSIGNLDSFITTEELNSTSSLTAAQYIQIKSLYDEAVSDAKTYYDNYGEYSDLPSLSNVELANSLITEYEQESNASVTESYTFDNSSKRDNYSYQWSTSYAARILTSGMFIQNTPLVTMNYSSASLQDVATMDCPVVKNGTVTINTPNSTINSIQVTLKQYSSKSKSITLKYYNGSELISCGSSSTFTNGVLVINSTSIPNNVSRVVVDLSSNENQVGVSSISLNLTTKAKDIIRQDYYASIENTYTGETLWSALNTLTTDTHTYKTSYKDCSLLAYLTDADPSKPGYIIDFYSHLSLDGTWDNGNTWNREHVWCQSKAWYGEIDNKSVNAGTDLHQLRPLYKSINSSRNNSQYGELTNRDKYLKTYLDTPYGYLNGDTTMGTGNGVFEPLDNVKGDVARVLLYMLVRYKEYISSYPLSNNVYTKEGTEDSVYKLLVKWNELDPVDELEINRNNAVYALQGNRNPFIDFPEYASRIWSNAE